MKNQVNLVIVVFILLVSTSSCGPRQTVTQFSLPSPMPGLGEPIAASELGMTAVPKLEVGNQQQCWVYLSPSYPSWEDILAYYQNAVEEQGWVGEPTKVNNGSTSKTAFWINKGENTGIGILYIESTDIAVCIGNP